MSPFETVVPFLNAEKTRRLLPYSALCDAVVAALRDYRAGRIIAPERLVVSIAEKGLLLLMPASDGRFAITKLVTVHPENGQRGLPTIQGELVVMEASSGRRLGFLDGVTVTARRTAAVSALAARCLAPDPAGALLIVGAGSQARAHLEAFNEILSTHRVYITSRTRAHAEALGRYAESRGIKAQIISRAESVLEEVTLIVTATNSTTPVLAGRLRADGFVAAVGAFTPAMAELPAEWVQSGVLYADTLEGARAEAGDFIQAGIDWNCVQPLAEAIDSPRPAKGPVIFKSVGHAMFDLAAAGLVFSQDLPSVST